MKYKNIIFDFDGTLSDTYPSFANAFLDTLHDFGMDDTYTHVYDLLKVSVGHAIRSYVFPVPYAEVSERFHMHHHLRAETEQPPVEGAVELLRYIRESGRKNYIYTHSGKIVFRVLEIWGITDLIDGIVDASVHMPRKPAPDGLNYLCEKFGLDKSESIMVGDRDIDTDCAKNAGVAGCLFDDGHYYDGCVADYRINALCELRDLI